MLYYLILLTILGAAFATYAYLARRNDRYFDAKMDQLRRDIEYRDGQRTP